jgi:hypothetical protein
VLRRAGLAGDILPWRDVLHEGPVRAGLSPDRLAEERAAFIAAAGWGDAASVLQGLRERDRRLREAQGEDEVVLWFEHDLYDQLQLIQVLDVLAAASPRRLTLICEPEYLGTMPPERAAQLHALRNPVSEAQKACARRAWASFCSSDPRTLETDVPELRFLGPAMRRLLEEYPWASDGLSRLERGIASALRGGPRSFGEIFGAVREEPAFLGDSVLLWHLRRLEAEGFVKGEGEAWALTGRAPRRARERWLGGVKALPDGRWRFDPALGRVVE